MGRILIPWFTIVVMYDDVFIPSTYKPVPTAECQLLINPRPVQNMPACSSYRRSRQNGTPKQRLALERKAAVRSRDQGSLRTERVFLRWPRVMLLTAS